MICFGGGVGDCGLTLSVFDDFSAKFTADSWVGVGIFKIELLRRSADLF
jgi:hypothetical protein